MAPSTSLARQSERRRPVRQCGRCCPAAVVSDSSRAERHRLTSSRILLCATKSDSFVSQTQIVERTRAKGPDMIAVKDMDDGTMDLHSAATIANETRERAERELAVRG